MDSRVFILFAILASVGAVGWWYVKQAARRGFQAALQAARSQAGIDFPSAPVLGNHGVGLVLDPASRKVVAVFGRWWRVFSVAEFTRCTVEERSERAGIYARILQFVVVIETTHAPRPRMEFFAQDRADAQAWVQQLQGKL